MALVKATFGFGSSTVSDGKRRLPLIALRGLSARRQITSPLPGLVTNLPRFGLPGQGPNSLLLKISPVDVDGELRIGPIWAAPIVSPIFEMKFVSFSCVISSWLNPSTESRRRMSIKRGERVPEWRRWWCFPSKLMSIETMEESEDWSRSFCGFSSCVSSLSFSPVDSFNDWNKYQTVKLKIVPL